MQNRISLVGLVLFLAILLCPVWAHEGHKKKPEPQTQTLQTQESQNPSASAAQPEVVIEVEELPPMSELMFAHLHNKVVHFPLAFGLAGALFVFLSKRRPQFDSSAKILWGLGAVLAVGAYFTGKIQEEPFENTYLEEILELHQTLGISTGISLWIGFLMLMVPKLKRLALLWAILLVVLISVTGFYGGVLAHAE